MSVLGTRSARPQAAPLLCALLLLSLAGCSIRGMAVKETAGLLEDGMVAIYEEPDADFAKVALPGNLKTLEVLYAAAPDEQRLALMLAQGYASYAYLFVEDEADVADAAGEMDRAKALRARADGFYQRAAAFALRSIDRKELSSVLKTGTKDEVRKVAASLEAEQAPALFWLSFAGSGRVNLDQSNPERLAELPRVEALVDRMLELDANYFHGLPLLVAGGLYASRPKMFGGDLERGKTYLERGIAVSEGRFLLGRFLMARYWAVQSQDHVTFCETLKEVRDSPPRVLPEQELMNSISQRWAARWRARAGDLFEQATDGCDPPEAAAEEEMEDDDGTLE